MSLLDRLLGRDPHSLAAPYALDALEPAERHRFERHLGRCGRCQAEVRALSEDVVRLAWSIAAPPPAALRDRVLSAVRATPQETAPQGDTRTRTAARPGGAPDGPARVRGARGGRPLFVPFATATAAAALVVASLFAVQATRTEDTLNQERAQAREIAHVLAAPDARATSGHDGRGRGMNVVASATQGRAVVTVTGLGAPPSGRVHQLWLMRPDVPPRSLGLLQGDAPFVAGGLGTAATSLAVTIEPAGGSPRPTSAPLVQLALNSVGFGE
ncbi:anti-sigma factor [Streptomyces sp. NPDC002004]